MKIKDVDRFLKLAEKEETKGKAKNQKGKLLDEDWNRKQSKKPYEKRRWRSQ